MKTTSILFLLTAIIMLGCDSKQGVVKGTLCYPSDYIPPMTVYLKNQDTKKIYRQVTKQNQKNFSFKEIPDGKYVAFAYTLDETLIDNQNKTSKAGGGYTQFVPCGLSVECEDHSLIEILVVNGTGSPGIEICDWYGAIIPPEPGPTNP